MNIRLLTLTGWLTSCLTVAIGQDLATTKRATPPPSGTFKQQLHLKDVLTDLERRFSVQFLYEGTLLENQLVSYDPRQKDTIEGVLQRILSKGLHYQRVDGTLYAIFPTTGSKKATMLPATTDRQRAGNTSLSVAEISLTGTVTDSETSQGLPGVSIVLKGTTTGTTTDVEGHYRLTVPNEQAVVVFSFVGYLPQEAVVGNRTSISVTLKPDTKSLDEVVVVGYGEQQKKLITGATSQVKGADIQKRNNTGVLDALKGQVAGLNITKASAQPGDGFKVSIRGLGTTGNSSPLYVVDGVPVPDISNLNPADIESLDVLKDAASAAIYGSRASNGVILLTTKKGKVGKASISYDGYFGIQNVAKKMTFLGAKDYLMLMSEYYTNNKIAVPNFAALIPGYADIANGTWDGTNWLDATSNKNAPIQNHTLNISGGNDQAIYSMGLSLNSEQGIVGKPATPTYDRLTFRMNSEYTIVKNDRFDVLKIGENVNYANTDRRVTIGEGAGNETSFASVVTGSPVIQLYNPDPTKQGPYPYYPYNVYGSPTGVAPTAPNPLAWLDYEKSGSFRRGNNLNGNIYLLLQPIKGLVFRSSFGVNSYATSDRSWVPAYLLSATQATTYFYNPLDRTAQSLQQGMKWIFDNTLTYKVALPKQHNLDVMVGGSAEKIGIGESISGDNANSLFSSFDYAYLINNKTVDPAFTHLSGSPLVMSRILSGFSRASYDYKQTYLFTAVFRADGSSNFATGKRWGYFPSVSAGWAMTNETFMDRTKGWLDYLKIRASWGQNGNQSISPFQYLSTISFNGAPFFRYSDKTKFDNGGYPNILSNPNVSWETSVQTDIGLDARLLGNRLGVTLDWYEKLTKDWLIQAPILASDGTGAPFVNGGDVQNKGIELALTWNDQVGTFTYGLSANVAKQDNVVTRIANPEGIIHGPNAALHADQKETYRAEVGKPIGYFWGLQTNGLFQNPEEVLNYKNAAGKIIQPAAQPGDLRYVDRNGDGVIDQSDYTMLGNPNPKFVFGFSFNCAYRGFDFSAITNGVAGNQVIWNYFNNTNHGTYNWSTLALSRWHGEGTSTTTPRINTGSTQDITLSDRFVADAGFWRMSNLTLGYNFKTLWPNSPMKQLRMYVSSQNLFTITNYEGFNPEVGNGGKNGGNWAGGVDSSPYPLARTFLLGASLKF
ncbi:SusC/RagA family TonB-linked outer membrane protein [Fibrella forsythiae]|uniref:SusC/RagA family TonB-linked outer membrane protein n=1 Tax=Fibrella forsythiae TaxID=2817061 RepID=A0ABS3JCI7_9BACT|nr:SusC/RagA family TonB-linked outer membrane protein [Fibrella forsythiae]MBO0947709.1 SusC/RagA family TonB-linked outer membrane protein [Fibrella forsythiae]